MAMKPKWLVAVAMIGALAVAGCEPVTPDFAKNTADVILRVLKVSAEAGGSGEEADFLFSDVRFEGGIINDVGILTLQVIPKNPNLSDVGNFNDGFLTDYQVRYTRSDGRNTEGLDVPYTITGKLSTLLQPGAEADIALVIVRHQAKFEPPLINLGAIPDPSVPAFTHQEQVLTVQAEVTVYGQTTSGRPVSATGYIDIAFADFPDE
jgi:hypothetical protein